MSRGPIWTMEVLCWLFGPLMSWLDRLYALRTKHCFAEMIEDYQPPTWREVLPLPQKARLPKVCFEPAGLDGVAVGVPVASDLDDHGPVQATDSPQAVLDVDGVLVGGHPKCCPILLEPDGIGRDRADALELHLDGSGIRTTLRDEVKECNEVFHGDIQ